MDFIYIYIESEIIHESIKWKIRNIFSFNMLSVYMFNGYSRKNFLYIFLLMHSLINKFKFFYVSCDRSLPAILLKSISNTIINLHDRENFISHWKRKYTKKSCFYYKKSIPETIHEEVSL